VLYINAGAASMAGAWFTPAGAAGVAAAAGVWFIQTAEQ